MRGAGGARHLLLKHEEEHVIFPSSRKGRERTEGGERHLLHLLTEKEQEEHVILFVEGRGAAG